ncbi:Uncharacterized metal-dependent phosphohydrolase MJ0778 [hydrothermal vent metagenome]|uniref:Uncharacterized metal-dependent phosphohydrolase MJ0778 n=1 Tax=hydrothermal vent metagenome TaxID=652676 RepID=A0A3B1D9A5_9ZZZZ
MEDKKDIELLKRLGCSDRVIEHILAVKRVALRIADETSIPVDRELVRMGALLHDIGRARTHGIEHAVVGAEMAREMGVDERIVRIIERHIGAGITADEARALGLPDKDYVPQTPEEKIVAYADNLVKGNRETGFEAALEEFRNIPGIGKPAIERFIRLHEEIEQWKQ